MSRRSAAVGMAVPVLAFGTAVALVVAVAIAGPALAAPAPAVPAPAVPAPAVPGSAATGSFSAGNYVVLLADSSAAAYEGGVRGYAATRPEEGKRFDARSDAVDAYDRYLRSRQDDLLTRVGAHARHRFTMAASGFSADLSAEQAATLAANPAVLSVTRDRGLREDTVDSPDFLGLTGAGGLWARVGGPAKAGAGVVVGVVDSGIWPESAAVAGKPLAHVPGSEPWISAETEAGALTAFAKADGSTFHGLCQLGQNWPSSDLCSAKLISARYFADGFRATFPNATLAATDQFSPRDGDGHGTHTAATAAGNDEVPVRVGATSYGTASGMAPAAKLAVYKACWDDGDPQTDSCLVSDVLAAVNSAIQDGVDVLNLSLTGSRSTVVDPIEFALYNAATAGIVVAASGGNNGPEAGTVAHNSPWVTTVGAATHAAHAGTVRLGNGSAYAGASAISTALPSTATVLSTAAAAPGAEANDARLCGPGSLDPRAVRGKVVVCDRGTFNRTDKSAEVARGGGVGMILANTAAGSLDPDLHVVPTVHVDSEAGDAIKAYVAGSKAPTAALSPGDTTGGRAAPVPQIAPFSSRGPAEATDGNLLKPDLVAPGVNVIAAVAPTTHSGRDFDTMSGSSMATPHVAGVAAVLLGLRPSWSPMAVKSALMTTAADVKAADGSALVDPLATGAGMLDARRLLAPGLLVTSTSRDWARFYAGQGLQLGSFPPLPAFDLNVPSIAVSALTGSQRIRRTFTAVTPGKYAVAVDLPGFTVSSETSLTFATAGEREALHLRFTRAGAPIGAWAAGFLTLTGPARVRLPIAVRPVAATAPEEVSASAGADSATFSVRTGFTGPLKVRATGLAPGSARAGSLDAGTSTMRAVDVPAGTRLARFEADSVDDRQDLDLSVYRLDDAGVQVESLAAAVATTSADENLNLLSPSPGHYLMVIDNASGPGSPPAAYISRSYLAVSGTGVGDLTVTPNPVAGVQGRRTKVTVSWKGLDPSTRYAGLLEYPDAPAPTVVLLS